MDQLYFTDKMSGLFGKLSHVMAIGYQRWIENIFGYFQALINNSKKW